MAAEKIKIFELDIDVDSAISSQSRLKSELDKTRESLKALKKSGDTTSQAYVELEAKSKNLSREYNAAQTQLGKLINLQGKEIETVEQGRNALTIINKEWAKKASLFGENSKEADALASKHKELKDRVNELQKGVGDTSGNIGNYSNSIQEAIGKSNLWNQATGGVTEAFQIAKPVYTAVKAEIIAIRTQYKAGAADVATFSGAQKIAAITTNLTTTALKALKVALISTGIGALLVLLGSAVAFFTKTQKGIDLVNTSLAKLGAGFDVVIDRASKFFGALAKFVAGDLDGAFDDIKASVAGLGDEIAREIDLAGRLEQVLQRVEKAEVNLDIRRSAANARLKELNLTIEDVTKSEEERLKAAQEFTRIESNLVSEEVANQEKRVAAMLGFAEVTDEVRRKIVQIGQEGVSLDQLGLSESTVEDAKEFRDEIGRLFDLQTRSFELQTTNQNKLNTITEQVRRAQETAAKEALEQREKAIDAAIKENQTRLKLYLEQNKDESKSLEESLTVQINARDARLKILQEEVAAGKKTKAEASLEEYQIKEEYLNKEKELVVQFAQEELEIYKSKNRSRIEEGELLTQAIVTQEQNRLAAIAQEQRDFEKTRLQEGIISEREYNDAIFAVNEEYKAKRQELDDELKQQQLERDAIDFENQQILQAERDGLLFETKLERLERDRQAEVEQAQRVGADLTAINDKFASMREQIKQQEIQAKLDLEQKLFGNVADLLGRQTAAGKAAGIAQATINTYQGVTEVLKSPSILPEPFATAQRIVSIATVIGSGLKAVQQIASTKTDVPKAEKGLLVGKRHSQGGVHIEAEDGEFIMNRKATSLFYPVIKYMNDIGNNGRGSSGTTFMSDGGMVARSLTTGNPSPNIRINSDPFDYELFARLTGDAVMRLPAPITDVKDIIGNVNNYNKVVNGANI